METHNGKFMITGNIEDFSHKDMKKLIKRMNDCHNPVNSDYPRNIEFTFDFDHREETNGYAIYSDKEPTEEWKSYTLGIIDGIALFNGAY